MSKKQNAQKIEQPKPKKTERKVMLFSYGPYGLNVRLK